MCRFVIPLLAKCALWCGFDGGEYAESLDTFWSPAQLSWLPIAVPLIRLLLNLLPQRQVRKYTGFQNKHKMEVLIRLIFCEIRCVILPQLTCALLRYAMDRNSDLAPLRSIFIVLGVLLKISRFEYRSVLITINFRDGNTIAVTLNGKRTKPVKYKKNFDLYGNRGGFDGRTVFSCALPMRVQTSKRCTDCAVCARPNDQIAI